MKLIMHKGGSGSGDFGHSGRPGKVGGSSGGKGRITIPKNQMKKHAMIREALKTYVLGFRNSSDVHHLMYRLRKNNIVIQDRGGYFGHMTTGFTNEDLEWSPQKGLTVKDVADYLEAYGAIKIPRAKRNSGAGISYSIYD